MKFQRLIVSKILKNIIKKNHLKFSDVFILPMNVKMPTVVGILTFMTRINFMLSYIEHEKSFITSGSDFWQLFL